MGFAYIVPGDVKKELEFFVEAGLSPLDALRTATINPARFLGLTDSLGVVALGRPTELSSHDTLAGPAHLWESRTPYLATRHAGRREDAAAMLARNVSAECVRRGLPWGPRLAGGVRCTLLTETR